MFTVAIIGGEYTGDYNKFKQKCVECLKNKVKTDAIVIRSIGDRYVDAFAERCRFRKDFFGANFKVYGKDALKVRAEQLLDGCDAVIAFKTDMKDIDMIIKKAAEEGLPLRVIK